MSIYIKASVLHDIANCGECSGSLSTTTTNHQLYMDLESEESFILWARKCKVCGKVNEYFTTTELNGERYSVDYIYEAYPKLYKVNYN